ncbi:hypothetical protein [Mesorhizobium sp.]|uniref:hypothetical protein n=1 Tax=Mesorhizobium sp. TaxID=1871066 RepID=UPI000FE8189B|nr:hypothetical protein [Mesorhizobium sp.]RWO51028.1 MAG: carbohydrate-binding family V/XII protein [Mesorhizobium sp.]
MSFDGKAFGKDIVAVVKSYVEKELAPIKARLAEMEGAGVKYLGVWQRQQAYKAGSMVTFRGGMWHANTDTKGVEPGDGKLWTLAVKGGDK